MEARTVHRSSLPVRPILRVLVEALAAVAMVVGPSDASKAAPPLEFVAVRAVEIQPDGPGYDFRISRFEVRNDQYVEFLNDALANLSAPAGQYLYFDLDSGDVFIHYGPVGVIGLEGAGTLLFRPSANRYVSFDAVARTYLISSDGDSHPVTGVSWFGAVKFCNWLTLRAGMDQPDQRAYQEGATVDDWAPVAPHDAWIAVRGFRLPMDGGTPAAGVYNEWYKSAAWDNVEERNFSFGFGRDAIASMDANFRGSGDSFEPGTTPVGFYDGENRLTLGGLLTRDSANYFGLYDLSGNAAEWVHDVGLSLAERGIRGGHFDNLLGSALLRCDGRSSILAGSTLPVVGFRVVQTFGMAEFELSQPAGEPSRISGYVGGPFDRESFSLRVSNLGEATLDHLAIVVDPPWLLTSSTALVPLAPGRIVEVVFTVSDGAVNAGVSPAPPGDFGLVSGEAEQVGGPTYDYWIERTEITNARFAAFLNDARANSVSAQSDPRSEHLYFDLDSGSVYVNDRADPEEGIAAPSPTRTIKLYDAAVGRIRPVQGGYAVEAGFADHPVVGVSWYGAVKYCNWRTIAEGIPPSLRAYQEAVATTLAGWHPVTVDDATWLSQGLPQAARSFLIEDTLGYRLPMDDGATGASGFNEWYKVASRGPDDADGQSEFDFVYGFGRNGLTEVDANFGGSGETREDGTTPVGFFDGLHTVYQEPPSPCAPPHVLPVRLRDTENGLGLYDVTGNVTEWTQEPFAGDLSARAVRGGSWRDPPNSTSLTNSGRASLPPEATRDDVGFRVVRGTGQVITVTVHDPLSGIADRRYFVLDLGEPFHVRPSASVHWRRSYRESTADLTTSYALTNRSATSMAWTARSAAAWLTVGEAGTGATGGTVPGGEAIELEVRVNENAGQLSPGRHETSVLIENVRTGRRQERSITLVIDWPIRIEPSVAQPISFTGYWGGPFDLPLSEQEIRLTSNVPFAIGYRITAAPSWLELSSVSPWEGVLAPEVLVSVLGGIHATASALTVGEYAGAIRFAFVDLINPNLGASLDLPVGLVVRDPIEISPSPAPWRIGPGLDAASLPSQAYTLENRSQTPVEVRLSSDADWLELDGDDFEVFPGPGQARTVTAQVNANALSLPDGEYTATIAVETLATGTRQCRAAILDIRETLSVAPLDGLVVTGLSGGRPVPAAKVYRLTNPTRDGGGPIEWRATSMTEGGGWLLVGDGPVVEGVLGDGESAYLLVAVDAANTVALADGAHSGAVEFTDLTNGVVQSRTVSLTLAAPGFTVNEAVVSDSARQPGGPNYPFAVGKFAVTNQEFVAFLNQALASPTDARGHYLYFDTTTGDVYLHATLTGESSPGPGSRSIRVFSPAIAEQIRYDQGRFEAVISPVDYSLHPLTGVSWYGAVKFCNWLTIDQGMSPAQRCYGEGPDADLAAWRPITVSIDDWRRRDLGTTERERLVTLCEGYRLPMDDGSDNLDPAVDGADAFNEWYKSAAWNESGRRNNLFGFGRDVLSSADANFRDSGDPFDNGTTPVGFYDGSMQPPSFSTSAGANSFGLFGMSGNVFQWMQCRFSDHAGSISFRTIRGGNWNDAAASPHLRTTARTFTMPSATDARIGFRVVRSLRAGAGDADSDGDIDAHDLGILVLCARGPGRDVPTGCHRSDADADGDSDLRDAALLQNGFTGPR